MAKSRFPSPLKSAMETALGVAPTVYGEPGASWKVPSAFPKSTVTLLEVELAMTKSGVGVSGVPFALVGLLRRMAEAMATGAVSVLARTNGELVAAAKFPLF